MSYEYLLRAGDAQNDRVIYFDLLRVAAVFFVIMLHVSAESWGSADVTSYEWQIYNLFDSISRWGVPVFVMISGALFLERNIPPERLLKKYVLKVMLLYFVWSLVYALIYQLILQNDLDGFFLSWITGHYHLWFLRMIAGLYLIVPFLKRITEDRDLTRYYLILGGVIAFAVPETVSLISLFSDSYASAFRTFIERAYLGFFVNFPVYFVLGLCLRRAKLSRGTECALLQLGVIGFLLTIVLSMWASAYKEAPVSSFYTNSTLNVAFEAVGVFILFRKLFSARKFGPKAERVISGLSKYTLGVYLVHPLVMTFFAQRIGLSSVAFDPLLSIPATTAAVYLTSFAISALLNQIPIVRKYLV